MLSIMLFIRGFNTNKWAIKKFIRKYRLHTKIIQTTFWKVDFFGKINNSGYLCYQENQEIYGNFVNGVTEYSENLLKCNTNFKCVDV